MPRPEAIPMSRELRSKAVDSVTRAFVDDPMWSCVLPDRQARVVVLRPMWNALVGYARICGEVLTTPEGEGAACWVRPGKARPTVWSMLRTGWALPRSMMRLPKDSRERFFRMMHTIDRAHSELMPEPHWYLWVLGVAPEAQGRGIGRALLTPILERAAAEGVPCYLETQTLGNVAFYKKCGFDVLDERRVPVCDLPIWYLLRGASS